MPSAPARSRPGSTGRGSCSVPHPVPPEIVVAWHVDHRHAREALAQPVQSPDQGNMHVTRHDGHVEASGRHMRGRVPGILRPILMQVREHPKAQARSGHVPGPFVGHARQDPGPTSLGPSPSNPRRHRRASPCLEPPHGNAHGDEGRPYASGGSSRGGNGSARWTASRPPESGRLIIATSRTGSAQGRRSPIRS